MSDTPRSLGSALRALPVPPVPEQAWQRLAQELPRRGRTPRASWLAAAALALAAGLGALLLPGRLAPPEPPRAVPQENPWLTELRVESARWDRLLAQLEPSVDSAASAVGQAAIGDRIAMIDLLLGDARDAPTREALWSERVLLLRQLYLLRSGASAQLAGHTPESQVVPQVL